MLERQNLNHVVKDPSVIFTIRNPIDDEILLALDLMPELIEQYENIPAKVQDAIVGKDYQALRFIQHPTDSAVQYAAAKNREFALNLPNISELQRQSIFGE